MSYQVLARKWRPKTFTQLVGQQHVVRALSHALTTGRLHHAWLLTGTRGVGKTTIARILAKALNCENGITAAPCGVCGSCTAIDAGRFVDLLELDAASHTGIDNMRDILDNAQYAPTAGRFKVYLIDEVHMLSKAAFNAMLKTLEEPPPHVKFILATTDPHKVPVTILSRCLQFNLQALSIDQLAQHLADILTQENISFEPSALQLLAEAAAGSVRDSLSLLDQAIAYSGQDVRLSLVQEMLGSLDRQALWDIIQALIEHNGSTLLAVAHQLAQQGLSFEQALQNLASLFHRLALVQQIPASLNSHDPEATDYQQAAQRISPEQLQLYYQICLHGRQDLALAPDEYTGFTMTLLRLLAFSPQAVPVTPTGLTAPPATQKAIPTRTFTPAAPTSPPPTPATMTPPPATAPAAPPPVQQAPLSEAKIAFNGDWAQLVSTLPLRGMVRQLAQHCQLLHHDVDKFELRLPSEQKALLGRNFVDSLKAALQDYFRRPLHITIGLGATTADTPAILAQRAKDSAQAEALTTLEQDPRLQWLQQNYQAVVLPDSLQLTTNFSHTKQA